MKLYKLGLNNMQLLLYIYAVTKKIERYSVNYLVYDIIYK